MMTWRRGAGLAALVLIAAGMAGCARPGGDFGRAEPSVLHDTILPAAGAQRARADGEPVSAFNLTDQERLMRDVVWRYLVAPHSHDWFYDTAVELQRTRITRQSDTRFQPDRYYDHLRRVAHASSRVRYQTLAHDIDLDVALVPGAFRAICAVIEVDRQRAVAIANVTLAAPMSAQEVAARKAENDAQIDWFVRALGYRHDSYAVALDRLLVETPHEEARGVDARLSGLGAYVAQARRGDFCAHGGGGHAAKGAGVPSRFETTPFTPEPLYRK